MSYDLNKKCEVCGAVVPDDFVNLLCYTCYDRQVKEIEQKQKEDAEERAKFVHTNQRAEQEKETLVPVKLEVGEGSGVVNLRVAVPANNGITDPNYQENPEAPDKDQVGSNLAQFLKSRKMLWQPTRDMYEQIKNFCLENALKHPQYPKFIWKPKIVDVGCGCGVGANLLSQEADFVWGIDKNQLSIDFAKECFTRVKNGIYYSGQVSFDCLDILEDSRDFMQFDVVVAIEVIEHIYDYRRFLETIIRKFSKRDKDGQHSSNEPTTFFISTPNRISPLIQQTGPRNKFHVREWRADEFYNVLSLFFRNVQLLTVTGEPVGVDCDKTPILARCSQPLL